MVRTMQMIPRALILLIVAVALLGGLGSGLARLGWQMDNMIQNCILIHGPLMISGFLGTLICLERAVALASRYRWSLIVPAVNALGAILLLVTRDALIAKLILTMGSCGLLVLFAFMLRLHPSRDVVIMALGTVCWLIGNVLWASGQPVYQVVHLWSAFLILTVVGERLELSRVRRLTRISENLLALSVAVYLMGVAWTIFDLGTGVRILGGGAMLVAGWLLRYDIARRTIQQIGLPRYIATCLLTGYVWLGFGGLLALWHGTIYAGPDYAAVLHSFLLGFVFSMIFGHAPIILPALTGLQLKYTPVFYGHVVLLHLTLVYRMYGNLFGSFEARQWGALLNVIAILLFLGITMATLILFNIRQQANLQSSR